MGTHGQAQPLAAASQRLPCHGPSAGHVAFECGPGSELANAMCFQASVRRPEEVFRPEIAHSGPMALVE